MPVPPKQCDGAPNCKRTPEYYCAGFCEWYCLPHMLKQLAEDAFELIDNKPEAEDE